MKTEITKIKLKLKNREIELTAQEARDIQEELNKLFGMVFSQKEYVPYPVYPAPIIIDRTTPYWPTPWFVTCSSSAGETGTLCMNVGQLTA